LAAHLLIAIGARAFSNAQNCKRIKGEIREFMKLDSS
jgi:hypothetical protein